MCTEGLCIQRKNILHSRNDLNVEIKADGANLKIVCIRLPLLFLLCSKREFENRSFICEKY